MTEEASSIQSALFATSLSNPFEKKPNLQVSSFEEILASSQGREKAVPPSLAEFYASLPRKPGSFSHWFL